MATGTESRFQDMVLKAERVIVNGTDIAGTEVAFIDGVTAGVVTVSKAVVVDANKDVGDFRNLDAVNFDAGASGTAGTVDVFPTTAAKGKLALTAADSAGDTTTTIVNASQSGARTYTIPDAGGAASFLLSGGSHALAGETDWTLSSASTDGGTSVEPVHLATTMTGAGGVGGRAKFGLTVNAALGSWSNALKAEVTYGASGKTTGLGSALIAEMTLSAGTVAGNYAPLELELNVPASASLGTLTQFAYMSAQGTDIATFDSGGYILNVQGLSAGASNAFRTGLTAATINAATTAALRIRVGGTDYFIPLATATA